MASPLLIPARSPWARAGPPAGDELTAAALAPIGPPSAYQRSLVSVCPIRRVVEHSSYSRPGCHETASPRGLGLSEAALEQPAGWGARWLKGGNRAPQPGWWKL